MKRRPEPFLQILSAVILAWLGWVTVGIMTLEKDVALLRFRAFGVTSVTVMPPEKEKREDVWASFGFPVPNLTKGKANEKPDRLRP